MEVSFFALLSVLSNGSLMDSSGVVGVEEPSSDWGLVKGESDS